MAQIHDPRLANFVRTIPLLAVPRARSSSVRAVGYDQDTAVLVVQLQDGLRGYSDVTPAELEALLTAASMRRHLETAIEPHRAWVLVDEPAAFA